ncbi:hypothetical protein M422DRAFT_234042 [Sphaerobolus stellatus SS14]|uniref:Cytochrome P450 n=1 Tax=Sphaerobolus stellatus (strain SS14) TaxID=990650 RepID=A0A0C9V4Z3_SPHS4|nr:hypothetical protein M422DRAFT_234042 [Sphaerobolus stellatus SS14]
MPELARPPSVGDLEFSWVKKFGTALHIKGPFGRDVLYLVDPKASQYVLNTSGYKFPKSPDMRFMIRLLVGRGIIWCEGEQHASQRKVIKDGLSTNSLRTYFPKFQESVRLFISKWQDAFAQDASPKKTNIHSFLAHLTLDSLGRTLDYDFGVLSEGSESELAKAYKNLFAEMAFEQSDSVIALRDLMGYLPHWMVSVLRHSPDRLSRRLKAAFETSSKVGKGLIDRQLTLLQAGEEGRRDIMGRLVASNLQNGSEIKIEELQEQLITLLLAGHETTASTMNWLLYELSRHPDIQNKLRKEIIESQKYRRSEDFTVQDFESMPLLQAILKETLRYHPIQARTIRVAGQDDIIPLSEPQKTTGGKTITEVAVEKGQRIIVSFAAFNRLLTSIWGEDAHVWNPERFLNDNGTKTKTGLGVISNLLTFSSGERSCIGWRFAILEMQSIICVLIPNFKISPPPGNVEIFRAASGLMLPMYVFL